MQIVCFGPVDIRMWEPCPEEVDGGSYDVHAKLNRSVLFWGLSLQHVGT